MLHPFLFVGVGGSGGDTLRHLYRELSHRLRRAGMTQMPTGWQFLHIDTRTSEEYSELLPKLPDDAYVGLVQRNVHYRTIVQSIDGPRWNPSRAACAGWRPSPDSVHIAVEEGAGQFRAVGRTAAIPRLALIRNKLQQAVQRVQQADARADLVQLANALGMVPDGSAPNPIAIVFSSLAGGTGSGVFLDVCDLLRGFDLTWTENSLAILYAPDVFKDLRDDQRRGVQANALATVSELLAGYWISAPGADPVHAAAGAVFNDLQRSGPGYPFLVGTNNGHLSFHSQQDVFAVVARTVAALATSPAMQKQFGSYVQSNWQQGAAREDPLQLVERGLDMPFSALGYASVGLGRDLFRRYVAQCLARAAAERLLHGAGGAPAAARPGADPVALIRQGRAAFTRAVLGLGDEAKDLFELFNTGRKPALDAVQDEIWHELGSTPRELDGWRRVLRTAINETRERFLSQQEKALRLRAAGWIEQVQGNVREQIRRSMAADGIVVTAGLLKALIDDLSETEIPALSSTAMADDGFAETFVKEMNGSLGETPAKRFLRSQQLFPADHARIRNGLHTGVETALGRALDARVRLLCAAILRDFVDNLLTPLATALTNALHALRKDSTSTDEGRPAMISQWPAGPGYPVSAALRPARTHFVIDHVDDYPDRFGELMVMAVDGAALPGDAVNQAIGLILTEDPEQDGRPLQLLEQLASWQPRIARAWSNVDRVEQPAAFRFRTGGLDLEARCDAWAVQAYGLGAYLNEKLAEALGGEQPNLDQQARLDRYAEQFAKAVSASTPLVMLDTAYTNMHLDAADAPYQTLISQIPLEPGSPAHERTRKLLLRLTNLTADNVDKQFDSRGSGEIEFTSFLNAPCHPVGFQSLTRPIQSDWQEKQTDPDRRAMFSKWRRARPLPKAVPLPQATRRKLMRGWVLAFALAAGEVELARRGQELVVRPRVGEPIAFPILGEPPMIDDCLDTMAAVIESLPLLLIEPVNSERPAQRAYRALLDLEEQLERLVARGFGDEFVVLVSQLAKEVEDRLPEESPIVADRVWELRDDISHTLRTLADWLDGR